MAYLLITIAGFGIGWFSHKLHEDGVFGDWWYSYAFIKFRNLFLFPIVIFGCLWKFKKDVGYKNFHRLAYKKMYKWQWWILDRLMEMKK